MSGARLAEEGKMTSFSSRKGSKLCNEWSHIKIKQVLKAQGCQRPPWFPEVTETAKDSRKQVVKG